MRLGERYNIIILNYYGWPRYSINIDNGRSAIVLGSILFLYRSKINIAANVGIVDLIK